MKPIAPFLFLLLLASCAIRSDMVQERRFQKRSHTKGWHVDIHQQVRDRVQRDRTRAQHVAPRRTGPEQVLIPAVERTLEASASDPDPRIIAQVRPIGAQRHTGELHVVQEDPAVTSEDPQEEPENLMPRKKLNWLAIPALVSGLSILALAFFSTNTLAVVVAIIITLTLSGISLSRMRKREQSGKGFALAGLMIGVIATIFTAIAIAAYGLD